MKNLVIFGTGAVAAELTSYLYDGRWAIDEGFHIKGYATSVDAGITQWEKYKFNEPYLGNICEYEVESDDYFILALANYKFKREAVDIIKSKNGKFITLIHPTALISHTAIIGEGNIFSPYTMVGPNVQLGDFNLLTSQSIISHDSNIGNYNFFSTSILCGHNQVGDDNFFGVKATTIPDVIIGNRNTIQAGMVIDKNIDNDTVVFYKYKEKIMITPVITV